MCPPSCRATSWPLTQTVGPVVDRAEVEQELPPASAAGDWTTAAVPDDRVVAGVVDAGGLDSGGNGTTIVAVEDLLPLEPALLEPDVGVVIGESPGAAEIDPRGAGELRTGVEDLLGRRCTGLRVEQVGLRGFGIGRHRCVGAGGVRGGGGRLGHVLS